MNNLLPAIKSTVTPAKIEWNKEQIALFLDEQLQQFENIVVTADTVKDNKSLVAALRKERTNVDNKRKEIKKALTEDVSLFEADVKDLLKKFDDVINPIDLQCKDFEQAEKDKKEKKIRKFMDALIESEGLNEKYQSAIVFDSKWLNKGTSMKSIEEEITSIITELGKQQDTDEQNEKAIIDAVKAHNEQNNLTLVPGSYVKMLDRYTLPEVIMQITNDVIAATKIVEAKVEVEPQVTIIDMPAPKEVKEEVFIDTWSVEGTEAQLTNLEAYAKKIGVKISVVE